MSFLYLLVAFSLVSWVLVTSELRISWDFGSHPLALLFGSSRAKLSNYLLAQRIKQGLNILSTPTIYLNCGEKNNFQHIIQRTFNNTM